MKKRTIAGAVVATSAAVFLWIWGMNQSSPSLKEPAQKTKPSVVFEPRERLFPDPRLRYPSRTNHVHSEAINMTDAEKTQFQQTFKEKIKPAVERWCSVYSNHIPFSADDVTTDKLKQLIFPGRPVHGYAFVLDGITVYVQDERGDVYVQYIMQRSGLDQAMDVSKPPDSLKKDSVTRAEILKLLKADSGFDFPPEQLMTRPTGISGAMNGGVYVDAGEGVNEPNHASNAEYSLVFGPDGKMVSYLRGITDHHITKQ